MSNEMVERVAKAIVKQLRIDGYLVTEGAYGTANYSNVAKAAIIAMGELTEEMISVGKEFDKCVGLSNLSIAKAVYQVMINEALKDD